MRNIGKTSGGCELYCNNGTDQKTEKEREKGAIHCQMWIEWDSEGPKEREREKMFILFGYSSLLRPTLINLNY